jgi:hypothetical protein
MTLVEQIMEQVKTLSPTQQAEVLNFVNFLLWKEERRKKQIKESLETLAEMETFADIKDPVEWQKQIRKDRPLPGREE